MITEEETLQRQLIGNRKWMREKEREKKIER